MPERVTKRRRVIDEALRGVKIFYKGTSLLKFFVLIIKILKINKIKFNLILLKQKIWAG